MPLILAIAALLGLKYFEVSVFADLSWWWIIGLMALAFLWFEFGEKMLGLDKRRAHESLEKQREERVKREFEENNKRRRK